MNTGEGMKTHDMCVRVNKTICMIALMLLMWGLNSSQAHAVSMGKILVSSQLAESFSAEIPLVLASGEHGNGVSVVLATPEEYRILNTYRDPVINILHTQIAEDTRGLRVVVVSKEKIQTSFFNLVLKISEGQTTHFKKYTVFIDIPTVLVSPTPSTSGIQKKASSDTEIIFRKINTSPAKSAHAFKPFDGWARIARYGPIVYGDTIMTVAQRLRLDRHYSLQQITMALFEKNKNKFNENNINLLKTNTYLDVPIAKEVEALTHNQAVTKFSEHQQRWDMLKKKPHYAAVAEAQKHRYSGRISVAKTATGVPVANVSKQNAVDKTSGKSSATNTSVSPIADVKTPLAAQDSAIVSPEGLQQKTAVLQKKLKAAERKIATLTAKTMNTSVAASQKHIKQLELKLARLQANLDHVHVQGTDSKKYNIIMYSVGGLVIVLLMVIAYLLRRERVATAYKPSMSQQTVHDPAPAVAEKSLITLPPVTEYETETASSDKSDELVTKEEPETVAAVEDSEEEDDQPVDHLAEAEIYLRFGIDDEAIQHLKIAIEEDEQNLEAHTKLVNLLHTHDDTAEFDAAVAMGRTSLTGDALEKFESTLESLPDEQKGQDDTDASMDLLEGGLLTTDTPEQDTPVELDMSDLSLYEEDVLSDKDDTAIELDMSDMELSLTDNDEPMEETDSSVAHEVVQSEEDGLLNLDGLDLSIPDEMRVTSSEIPEKETNTLDEPQISSNTSADDGGIEELDFSALYQNDDTEDKNDLDASLLDTLNDISGDDQKTDENKPDNKNS